MRTPLLETLEKASLIGMPVELIVDATEASHDLISETQLHAWLSAVRDISDDPRIARDICVRVCNDEESRNLNRIYRGKDAPTNILSFPAEVDIPDPPLGDLAMCWSVIKLEAAEQHKSLHDHCAHLFVHGVLHLLGYDHVEAAEALEMEALEVLMLARLGIANPYE